MQTENNTSASKAKTGKATFVLVHGAWHGAWCFERVIPLLSALGHAAIARDLPAHGLNARFPASYFLQDTAALATEVSPTADTTLDDYVDSIIATIDQARALGSDKIVLVGHSMGGVAITAAAQRAPEKIHRLVYLSAFMPKSAVPGVNYVSAPENAGELVGPQVVASPGIVRALRINHRSTDLSYKAKAKQVFYGDATEDDFNAALNLLTPDVPIAPFATPITLTQEAWGSLDRHYIKCLNDMAIRPALQQRFIDEADAFMPQRKTTVHSLPTDHSPFLSAPQDLANLLAQIAA